MLRRAAQAGGQLLARSRAAQLQQQRFLNVHEYQVRPGRVNPEPLMHPACC